MTEDVTTYLAGERLYGDDFDLDQIREWFEDEAEGYADLGAKEKLRYQYSYHALNRFHAFRFIQARHFDNALGIGSAYGDEFEPIAGRIARIIILEPSDAFSGAKEIFGIPCVYKKPSIAGNIPFESNHFDLITSLGVMHHIPNVSHVLAECYRCLSKDGCMLLREPINSMGDWRKVRTGLTKRERGIPLRIMDDMIRNIGFRTARRSLCSFAPLPKLADKFGITTYNNDVMTAADALLSSVFSWNVKYHRTRIWEKFAPAAVYYVLEK